MAHTEDYGTSAIYTNDIAVSWNTVLSFIVQSKTEVYGTLRELVLRSMIGLCSN